MEEIATQSKDEALKSQIAIRCANAALLLSSLKSFPNRPLNSTSDQQERELMLKAEVEYLKRELVKERVKNKKLKLCSFTEFSLQIALLLSLWTVCLMFAVKFL